MDIATLSGPGKPITKIDFGRVDSINASYLGVKIQEWTGTPPTVQDKSAGAVTEIACYPEPGLAVTDYSIDQYVIIVKVKTGVYVAKVLA